MRKRILCCAALIAALAAFLAMPAYAAEGDADLAGVVVDTWNATRSQAQTIVNDVVFPALDFILGVAFFVTLGMSYFKYRKHGQFDITAPAILFASLIFTLTAPLYIWKII